MKMRDVVTKLDEEIKQSPRIGTFAIFVVAVCAVGWTATFWICLWTR